MALFEEGLGGWVAIWLKTPLLRSRAWLGSGGLGGEHYTG